MKIKERDKLPDAKVFILDKDPKEVSIKAAVMAFTTSTIFFPILHYNLTPAPFKKVASSSSAHLGFAG